MAIAVVNTHLDVVDFKDGVTSLREAIFAANTLSGADTIQFDSAITGAGPATIFLTHGELAITESLTIDGPGMDLLAIDAQLQSRVFNITANNGDFAISGLTLERGRTTANNSFGETTHNGGAIRSVTSGALTLDHVSVAGSRVEGVLARGGGIFTLGALSILNSVISGSSSSVSDGGGIAANGPMTMIECTVSSNTAYRGAGIAASGSTSVTNCTINANTAAWQGGGIYSDVGTLTISGSTISNNEAVGSRGGGVFFRDTDLDITSSTISGNSADSQGGGIYSSECELTLTRSIVSDNSASLGGGMFVQVGRCDISHSEISGNVSTSGGGICANRNYLAITGSMVDGNTASEYGGGLFIINGNFRLIDSTISGNSAETGGGIATQTGTYLPAPSPLSSTVLTNSTISENTATSRGGGIDNARGLTIIQFCTFTENQAPFAQGSGVASEGRQPIRTEVQSSIIAGNVNSDVDIVDGGINSFQSNGYNLIGTGNALGDFNQPGDQTGVIDPLLGPLANNGGQTPTHALLSGSPALDSGDPSITNAPKFDQRNVPFTRVFDFDGGGGARIDIGALEQQPIPPAVFGDYNQDSFVDAADYVWWRKLLGVTGVSPHSAADGDTTIDQDDYSVWTVSFGETVPPGAGSVEQAASISLFSRPSAASSGPNGDAERSADAVRGHETRAQQETAPRVVSRGLRRFMLATGGTQRRDDALLLLITSRVPDRGDDAVDSTNISRREKDFALHKISLQRSTSRLMGCEMRGSD